jgi:hypothetical protein
MERITSKNVHAEFIALQNRQRDIQTRAHNWHKASHPQRQGYAILLGAAIVCAEAQIMREICIADMRSPKNGIDKEERAQITSYASDLWHINQATIRIGAIIAAELHIQTQSNRFLFAPIPRGW